VLAGGSDPAGPRAVVDLARTLGVDLAPSSRETGVAA